jgi:hypothetical protein
MAGFFAFVLFSDGLDGGVGLAELTSKSSHANENVAGWP